MATLKANEKVRVTAQPVDVNGNPAPVDGPLSWSISDPLVADVALEEGSFSAFVVGKAAGAVQLRVNGTSFGNLIEGVLDFTVEAVPLPAVQILLTAEAPIPQ